MSLDGYISKCTIEDWNTDTFFNKLSIKTKNLHFRLE